MLARVALLSLLLAPPAWAQAEQAPPPPSPGYAQAPPPPPPGPPPGYAPPPPPPPGPPPGSAPPPPPPAFVSAEYTGPAPIGAPPPGVYVPRRYGDAGMVELILGFGYASPNWWSVGGGARYFVFPGIAPGVSVLYQGGGGFSEMWILGSLRVVPLRTPRFALSLTAEGGPVFLSHHSDGWAVGGEVAALFLVAPHFAVEFAWELLRLLPDSFCNGLNTCWIQGPIIGFRVVF